MSYVEQVVNSVSTVKEAQEVIAALTEKFAKSEALEVFKYDAFLQKRSWRKVAYRTVGNLLRYGRTHRPY